MPSASNLQLHSIPKWWRATDLSRQQCDAKLGSRLSSCLHPDCLAILLCLQSREVTIDVVWALVCDPPLQCLYWQSVS